MNTIDTILANSREGKLTRREAVAALARLITVENVADIMSALPAEVAADVARWAATVPAQGGVVIGANLTNEETLRIAERLQVASRAVREWTTHGGRSPTGNGVEAQVSPLPSRKEDNQEERP
jgi:hypothetical protein